ncbi:RmlD substrate binding domain-containing protein [Blyttiomyces helicus]|uniref:RmlD substrate binding domain-containing protein n=1 Tax=Blyttiomyces helicus TaxID=388810 RepID=A0A4P9W737_9FUNG|nr:RmlD substrate binding domain-containing protein [Blyttiomyces helicus]|eukprot:RKO87862.1 RmlD substrate binding domain-containing protein [Blyttiomyces helicus]
MKAVRCGAQKQAWRSSRGVCPKDGVELVAFSLPTFPPPSPLKKVIVHCAAERCPDISERDHAATIRLNVKATEHLAKAAVARGALLMYISSDYLFDGSQPPYEIDAKPNPLNFYGKCKYEAELAVRAIDPSAIVIRIPLLYGAVEYNAEATVNVLADFILNKEKSITVDNWQIRYLTNVADVAKIIRILVDENIVSNRLQVGVFHFSAKERFTKYAMCAVIAKAMGQDMSHIVPHSDPPKEPVASRPADAQLATTRLEQAGLYFPCVGFEDWFAANAPAS